MDLYVLTEDERQTALSYNDPSYDDETGFTGVHQDVTLPVGYRLQPRPIDAGPPYPYAGMYILNPTLASNASYVICWPFFSALTIANIDPDEAFPDG